MDIALFGSEEESGGRPILPFCDATNLISPAVNLEEQVAQVGTGLDAALILAKFSGGVCLGRA